MSKTNSSETAERLPEKTETSQNRRERADYEVERAYRDCHTDDFGSAQNVRNLDFRASVEVNKADAEKIMQAQVPHGYNEFSAALICQLPDDSRIRIAREGLVCLYVRTAEKIDNTYLKEDELDEVENGVWRIWWD